MTTSPSSPSSSGSRPRDSGHSDTSRWAEKALLAPRSLKLDNPSHAGGLGSHVSSSVASGQPQLEANSPDMPQLGATFIPSAYDDYRMPEVIAPSPRRIIPKVQQQMQDGLTRLELEAKSRQSPRSSTGFSSSSGSTPRTATATGTATPQQRQPPLDRSRYNPLILPQPQPQKRVHQLPRHPAGAAFERYVRERQIRGHRQGAGDHVLLTPYLPPSFNDGNHAPYMAGPVPPPAPAASPFPRVGGENIPPNDEEKEDILSGARDTVLRTTDIQMQLSWARDVLLYAEVHGEDRSRRQHHGTINGRGPAERLRTPEVEYQLRTDAVNIVSFLSEQGQPDAVYMVGKWLEFGKFGRRCDHDQAVQHYQNAKTKGVGRAAYRLGMFYENANDIKNAIAEYEVGVRMKDSASYYRLGMMYLMGHYGHQKDPELGLSYIQIAADSADEDAPQGAYVYGLLIARELPDITIPDELAPYEPSVARQYVEMAAYLGFAKAQLKMGQAYELSQLGCDFAPAHSLHYYGLAAKQGLAEASLGVSRWFLFGFENAFDKNEKLSYMYAQDAALEGLPTGEFAMGYYHEIGIHVPKDVVEAKRWYHIAADHGNKDAQTRINALMANSKTLTKQDHETTTLTRIKSQYGSQRGKRPARLSQPQGPMATLNESPGVQGRPAFNIKVDSSQSLPVRSKPITPYPDDAPLPLNTRSAPAAPYPDDDMGRRPNYGAPVSGPADGPGPHADQPGSAFGIRAVGQPGAAWQSQRPGGSSYGSPPGGYGQGPLSSRGGIPPAGITPPAGSIPPAGSMPSLGKDAGRGRLQMQNPNPKPGFPPGPYGAAASQQRLGPGTPYPNQQGGGRRPVSDTYGRGGPPPDAQGGRLPMSASTGNMPPGPGSYDGPSPGGNRYAASGPQPPRAGPVPLMSGAIGGPQGGRSSAPPAQMHQRPAPLQHVGRTHTGGTTPPIQSPLVGPLGGSGSQAPNVASSTRPPRPGTAASSRTNPGGIVHPDGKSIGQGPATFEEMGIPTQKEDGECVVM